MTNRELVQAFYKEFFNDHIIAAAEKYVREDYKQHNPGVGQGRQALMTAFGEKFRTQSDFHLDIKMIISEDDMVAVYLKNTAPDGTVRCRVVDIYRVENGQLAEHWDVLQPTGK
ncbi:MAG: ester cyclase [Lachnospiraceae bacterium]|nr:ester cyclase [Lachnospiraceae bacterium]